MKVIFNLNTLKVFHYTNQLYAVKLYQLYKNSQNIITTSIIVKLFKCFI